MSRIGTMREGRKTRARIVIELLQLALVELDAAAVEIDPARLKERVQLANRMIADAVISVNRWEARG